ncbi:MAG: TIGR02450 family Trp-rich protein [Deltaproteobacteria bacterium]|nr:TIGR02450 family Trp-rich protein [Deltaproteobacteria bacterium]
MSSHGARRRRASPAKLLQSKWTAVAPVDRELHFVVTGILPPRSPDRPYEQVELTSIYSGRVHVIDRRTLSDRTRWSPGWL